MTLTFNPQLENSPLNDLRDAIDSGSSEGVILVQQGGTTLVTLTFSPQSFPDSAGGTTESNDISPGTAVAGGDPDSFEVRTGDGLFVYCGVIPDDLDIEGSMVSGDIVTISGVKLTEGVVQDRLFATAYAGAAPSGALLAESGEPILTESDEFIFTE